VRNTLRTKGFYEFGPYRLDADTPVLFKDGAIVPLTPKVLGTLKPLLENAGEVIPKEQLLRTVWPDTFVEESSLAQNISVLRKALGSAPGGGAYIETVAKRGYRFITEVRVVQPAPPPSAPEEEPLAAPPAAPVRKWIALAATALVLAAMGGMIYKSQRGAGGPTIGSIAVLPFKNLSGDAGQDYLANGITELLTTQLGKDLSVRVISRASATRFRDSERPLSAIAKDLGVEAVLEGSVARQGDHLWVAARLIYARTERQLWAESYDRDLVDVLILEEEIAWEIAGKIKAHALHTDQGHVARVNRGALEAYLRGTHYLDQRTEPEIRKAITWYQKAIEEDPAYAAPYAGLADCYNQLGTNLIGAQSPIKSRKLAIASARRALEIDPGLAQAHAALAYANLYDWNWVEAKDGFLRAIQANPSYAPGHLWFAHYLAAQRQFDRALQEAGLARDLDPLSPIIRTQYGWILGFAGRHQEAIEQFRAVLEDNPNYQWALWRLGSSQMALHEFDSAIETLKKAAEISHRSPSALATLGHAYGLSGQRDKAKEILDELLALSHHRYVSPQSIVHLYMGLTDRDKTFEWLEKCYQERANTLIWLNTSPIDDPMRADPRFDSLLRRVGLK
jgi:TolB-like protein/DNA-binding winged helix-turn-helix (wHTH) protein/Tfp pilus assembly protein PilF